MARNGLKQKHETVTRELQYKFQHNINLSPLDICLKQSIISKDMHKCANFFIYLYYVRYGNQRLISHYGYSIKTRLSIKDPITEEK
jgi:membrane protein insertase Oxa1/YidC/SpoIIIJ